MLHADVLLRHRRAGYGRNGLIDTILERRLGRRGLRRGLSGRHQRRTGE
jgi:hypothetical protein